MDACIENLTSEGIVRPVIGPMPITMQLFLKRKDEYSSRVICDLRPLNALYTTSPPRFKLPSVAHLIAEITHWEDCLFTKLDITAYYHSLTLRPEDLLRLQPSSYPYHPFVFYYRGCCWVWTRLPFGWSWAPVVAQTYMEHLIAPISELYSNLLVLVYYDDILLASPHYYQLLSATYTTVAFLQAQNSRLSLHKCNLKPVRKIEWLGKCISHRTVSNKTSRSRQIAGVLLGVAPAEYCAGY